MKSLICVGILSLSLFAQQPGAEAGIGDKVADFDFPTMLLNGDGRSKLSEFRGSPVILDFWGTH